MADALRAEVDTLRADRTLQGRAVTGGARLGTVGKRTTYAFPDVPGAGLPDDTPVRLVLDDGREIDGEVASRNERELVLALAEDVGALVEHAYLIADASFLLERLAWRIDEVLDGDWPLSLDLIAKVLGLEEPKAGRVDADVPELNDEQRDAVALALGSDVAFVWGPPGTGKTTTVAYVVAEHVRAGRSVLLVANTNTAVDTAVGRVAALLPDEVAKQRVLRHGTVVQPAVESLAPKGEEYATLLAEADVVATTVYQTWLGGLPEREYDVVVVDEASMLMLPMTAYAAGLATSSVVVAGDFRQLPAIVSDTSADVLRWLGRDAFVAARVPDLLAAGTPPPWLAALRTQYRMRPEIAALVSDVFYADNPLATGRTSWPDGPPLEYVDTSVLGAWAGTAGRGSRFNPVHAVLVAAVLSSLDDGVAGVVTPYGAQERLIAALLTDRAGRDARGWVSTVHRFQGNEQDVVVVDLADGYGASPGPVSRAAGRDDPQARLLNVAVSRARNRLLVLGDAAFLAAKAPRGSTAALLLRLLRERGVPLDLTAVARGAFAVVDDDARVTADLETAFMEVALFSPSVTGHGMARWSATLRSLLARGVEVRVVTRPPAEQPRAAALLDQMRSAGVTVDLWSGMGERALVVDTDLTYVGGSDLGLPETGTPMLRVKGSALVNALTDLLRPPRAPRRTLGNATNPPCEACDGVTVLRRGGGLAAYVCALGRSCPGLVEVPEEERGDKPEDSPGPCRQPGCTGWLARRKGRYGSFVSCTRYPACSGR